MLKLLISGIFLIFWNSISAQLLVSSESGTMLRLTPEGSWEEVEIPQPNRNEMRSYNTPSTSQNLIKGHNNKFGVKYNQEKWDIYGTIDMEVNGRKKTVLQFTHKDGDAIGLIIEDSIPMSPKQNINQSLQEIKGKSSEFNVAYGEVFEVNDNLIYMVIVQVVQKGIPITYFNYYYSGAEGSFELLTFCNQKAFVNFEDDFKDLLNGFIIYSN